MPKGVYNRTSTMGQGPQRKASHIRKHFHKVNDKLRTFDPKLPVIVFSEVEKVYKRCKGRCQICGTAVFLENAGDVFHFYVPLENGGPAKASNLILMCSAHSTVKKRPQDVVDINSFADLCEQLIIAVQNKQTERISIIKRMMNWTLEDIAATMRYEVFDDWRPDKVELVYEGRNTIPDLVEKLVEVPEVKEEITEQVKQLTTAKKYKVLRHE